MYLSVLMTVYNGEQFLEESVVSVLESEFKDLEFVIVDDGSTDKTSEILKHLGGLDSRIKILRNIHNLGIVNSKNLGLKYCTGKYIAMMDADDISMPNRFSEQIIFMDMNPTISNSGTSILMFDGNSNKRVLKNCRTDNLEKFLLIENIFNHPTVILRHDDIKSDIFYYSSKYKFTEDYELWTRVAYKLNFGNLDKPLLLYRYGDSATQNSSRKPIRRELELIVIRTLFLIHILREGKIDFMCARMFLASFLKSSIPSISRVLLSSIKNKRI
jgi:glycosyltransferase involved in cell wall biosynthesis